MFLSCPYQDENLAIIYWLLSISIYLSIFFIFFLGQHYFSVTLQSLGTSSTGDLKELIVFKLPILIWRVYALRKIQCFLSIRLRNLMFFFSFINLANTSVLDTVLSIKEEAKAFQSCAWISLVDLGKGVTPCLSLPPYIVFH